MALTLLATPDLTSTPPRVRIDVSGAGALASLTVYRQAGDGHRYMVRTSDGGPLPLSGGAATIYDYEAPYDSPISYTTDQAGGPTVNTELDVIASPWLIHVGVPSRSRPVNFAPGSFDTLDRPISQGVFAVLNRNDPVVVNSGARLLPSSTFLLQTETTGQAQALDGLFSDGAPLLLNVPPVLGYGIEAFYISVGDVKVSRPSTLATTPDRLYTVSYQAISWPAGGTQAAITWADVAGQYATWTDLAAAVPNWRGVSAPTA